MAKRVPQTRGPAITTKIPIYTLSGGVSRQPQSKRLASEAQEMDNALVSLERSFEKRPGFEIVPQYKATNIWDNNPAISLSDDSKIDLFPLEHNYSTEKDYWFYWFNINDNNRFLVVIDYKATGSTDVLLYVFRIRPDGTWSNETQYSASNQQNSSIISATTRSYITYGSSTNKAKDVLKATTVGNSIIILNTLVKAGFTSGEVGWNGASTGGFTFNLDGSESANPDNTGKAITYYSAARYAKGANSKWYLATGSTASCTVTGTADVGSSITITGMSFPTLQGTGDTAATTRSTQTKIYVVQTGTPANMIVCSGNDGSTGNNTWTVEKKYGATISTAASACTVYYGYYPEVEDFIWHDTTQPWLGQSLADFSEIRFPPELAEVNANNGLFLSSTTYDGTAKTMLANLYPSDGNTNGFGKIYYTAAPYLNFTSGYYRIISSASKPYTKKVRSPDSYSVLDKTRMPQKITFNASAAGTTSDPKWFAAPIEWEPRTSGNRYSNPGPSVFLTDDKKKPRQVAIKAVSTFRDRLYFAAEDVIFTSQLGVYEDLFFTLRSI